MARRFAVLWSLDHDQSIPIGVAVEFDDHVLVDVPDHLCIPARYRGPYEVIQPDSSALTYRPGDQHYFDQVLLDLSRMLAVGERGEIEGDNPIDVLDLLREKVLEPLRSTTVGRYWSSRQGHGSYHAAESIGRGVATFGSSRDEMLVAV
jgi:hypothetical protein